MRWFVFFFFNDTATTEIYTLSLHDALPIWIGSAARQASSTSARASRAQASMAPQVSSSSTTRATIARDRKSTRLNSSHLVISYAVFCLKKKKYSQHQCECSACQVVVSATCI